MATLELTIEQDASALPARRGRRRLGLLFWFAIGWVIEDGVARLTFMGDQQTLAVFGEQHEVSFPMTRC